jgi:hypothetical protein
MAAIITRLADLAGGGFLDHKGGSENSDIVASLGGCLLPGGLIVATKVPEEAEAEPVDLFPLASALLHGEVGK